MGIADDVDQTGSGGPANADQIMNLRRKAESSVYRNFGLNWSQMDRSKWYYTSSDTANDSRFSSPGTFFLQTDQLTTATLVIGSLYVDYELEFAGRTLVTV